MSLQVSPTTVIVVTYNSERFLDKCMDSLKNQTQLPSQIILSDTGSSDLSYVKKYESNENTIFVEAGKRVGFCRGNNRAYQEVVDGMKYVLLLNPDAFLFPDFIEKASSFMESTSDCGCCTGTLLGYDIDQEKPSGLYDSTGVFRTWYGKWYDRDQRLPVVVNRYTIAERVPAVCGALMFLRKEALDQILVKQRDIFDPQFYMYKEDIDLSNRLTTHGWLLMYNPYLRAFHCRGWARKRKEVPLKYRLISARNELKIQWRCKSIIGLVYSSMKYIAVKILNF